MRRSGRVSGYPDIAGLLEERFEDLRQRPIRLGVGLAAHDSPAVGRWTLGRGLDVAEVAGCSVELAAERLCHRDPFSMSALDRLLHNRADQVEAEHREIGRRRTEAEDAALQQMRRVPTNDLSATKRHVYDTTRRTDSLDIKAFLQSIESVPEPLSAPKDYWGDHDVHVID